MQVLFYANKRECGQRQNQLGEFRSLLAETQWLLPPLRSRAVAKMANMHKDGEIQQRTEQGDDYHWNPNRVGMKSDDRCSCPRAEGK